MNPDARLSRALDRFMSRIDRTGPCWLWTGSRSPLGYARFKYVTGSGIAHRWYWEHLNGPVPEGNELDHLCRVRHCVNPDHLEPVTHTENVRRGNGGRKPSVRCPAGHEMSGDNVYVRPDGKGRGCRACRSSWRVRAGQGV